MDQEQLDEWREHPVTRALKAAMLGALEREREAVARLLWAGDFSADADRARMRVLVREEFVEDFFELDEDDLRAATERSE